MRPKIYKNVLRTNGVFPIHFENLEQGRRLLPPPPPPALCCIAVIYLTGV